MCGRLYSFDEEVKQRAIRGLGILVGATEAVGEGKVRELLRRFFWALNDESGAAPYGAPEAIGEILSVRPEFQPEFLRMLCGLLTETAVSQTGPIERGVFWAVGRVGWPAARCSPKAAAAVAEAAQAHPDPAARSAAGRALFRLQEPPPV